MRFICVIFNIECKMNKLIVVESTVDKQTPYNFLFISYGNIRHSTIFSYFWSFHFLNLLNIGGVNKTNANFFFLDLCKWRVPRWLEIACVRECFLVFIDTSDFLLRRSSLQNFSTRVFFYIQKKNVFCIQKWINWYFNNRSFNAWILLTVKVICFKSGSISIT